MEREEGLLRLFSVSETPVRFNVHDRGSSLKEYSMCYDKRKPELKKWCGPDWVFTHWPSANISSFRETVAEIERKSRLPPILQKVGWYGNVRSPLSDVPEHTTRPLLKKIGDAHPLQFDIFHVAPLNGVIDEKVTNYLTIPDLTQYAFLLDIGGNGYSGRLKFLLYTKRPLLIVERNYVEYFHDDLIPYEHYVPVKEGLSDLLEKVTWMQQNYETCLEMAGNAYAFAKRTFTEENLAKRIKEVCLELRKA
jgi:Glycosyl transferase family 90